MVELFLYIGGHLSSILHKYIYYVWLFYGGECMHQCRCCQGAGCCRYCGGAGMCCPCCHGGKRCGCCGGSGVQPM